MSLCASDKYPFQSKPGLWTGCWVRWAAQIHQQHNEENQPQLSPAGNLNNQGLDHNEIYAPNTLVTAIKALKMKGKKAASVEAVVWNLVFFFFLGGATFSLVGFGDKKVWCV